MVRSDLSRFAATLTTYVPGAPVVSSVLDQPSLDFLAERPRTLYRSPSRSQRLELGAFPWLSPDERHAASMVVQRDWGCVVAYNNQQNRLIDGARAWTYGVGRLDDCSEGAVELHEIAAPSESVLMATSAFPWLHC